MSVEQRRHLLNRKRSILDAVRADAKSVSRQVNATDRQKVDEYFGLIRNIEDRLARADDWLDRPKPESPIDEVLDEERQHIDEVALFYDLMALALQTDSTRVATLETGMAFRTAELNLGSYH